MKDLESWGILTLMTRMKDHFLYCLDKERSTIMRYQLQPYEDSPLQFLDLYREAFERKFSEEFEKIYNEKENEYNSKRL